MKVLRYQKCFSLIFISFFLSFFLQSIQNFSFSFDKSRHLQGGDGYEENWGRDDYDRNYGDSGIDIEEVDKICKKGSEDIYLHFYSPSGEEEIKDSGTYKMTKSSQALLNLIKDDGETVEYKDIIIPLIPFAAFIVISIFSIIGCFVCCCCCCCPCCCCKQTSNKQKSCKLVSYVIAMTLFGVAVVGSVYGLIASQNTMKGLNGLTCTVMNFVVELQDGQKKETIPKWVGIQGIVDNLNDVKNSFNNVTIESETIDQSEIKRTIDDSKTKIKELAIYFNDQNGQNDKKVTPMYVDFSSSALDKANEESSSVITQFNDMTKVAKEASDEMQNGGTDFINSIEENLNDFNSAFDEFSSKISVHWFDYQGYINDYGKLGFNVLFGVLLGLSGLIIVFTTLFVCLKIHCFKFFIHVFWLLLMLITLTNLIVGAVFGILGIVGKDATRVVQFILSKDNLDSENPVVLEVNGESKEALLTCFHRNGNFFEATTNKADILDNINKLYDYKKDLVEVKTNLEKTTVSSLDTLDETLNVADQRYLEVHKDITELLTTLNTKVTQCGFDDLWVVDKSLCEGRVYVNTDNSSQYKPGDGKYCLVAYDWTEKEVKRYNNNNDNNKTCETTFEEFKKEFQNISKTNKENTSKIREEKKTINNKFKEIIDKKKESINNAIVVIDNIDRSLSDLLGEGKMEDSLNCKFVGENTKLLISVIHDKLGHNFYVLGLISELVNSAILLGVCFLLVVTNRYHKSFKKKKKGEADKETEKSDEKKDVGGFNKSVEEDKSKDFLPAQNEKPNIIHPIDEMNVPTVEEEKESLK